MEKIYSSNLPRKTLDDIEELKEEVAKMRASSGSTASIEELRGKVKQLSEAVDGAEIKISNVDSRTSNIANERQYSAEYPPPIDISRAAAAGYTPNQNLITSYLGEIVTAPIQDAGTRILQTTVTGSQLNSYLNTLYNNNYTILFADLTLVDAKTFNYHQRPSSTAVGTAWTPMTYSIAAGTKIRVSSFVKYASGSVYMRAATGQHFGDLAISSTAASIGVALTLRTINNGSTSAAAEIIHQSSVNVNVSLANDTFTVTYF